jgi:hypothetical protein
VKKVLPVGIAALLLVVFALACGDEEITEPDIHYRVLPTSPKQVLVNVAKAFNRRDANLLRAMLSENFVFYFDPADVGQTPPTGNFIIPESVGYTEFWLMARNMLELAYDIQLDIPTGGVGNPEESAQTFRAENVTISILVMVDELNGYIADRGYQNFEFEKYKGAEGHDYWRLTGWWDHSHDYFDDSVGASPATFGRVLALYR